MEDNKEKYMKENTSGSKGASEEAVIDLIKDLYFTVLLLAESDSKESLSYLHQFSIQLVDGLARSGHEAFLDTLNDEENKGFWFCVFAGGSERLKEALTLLESPDMWDMNEFTDKIRNAIREDAVPFEMEMHLMYRKFTVINICEKFVKYAVFNGYIKEESLS